MKQTAFITGSSRGIGRAIAYRFAKSGYQIILHASRPSETLTSTEKELKKLSAPIITSFFDVSNSRDVKTACKSILKKTNSIDVLVNNAGITQDKTFMNMSEKDWDIVIKTNLYGPFYITQQILPIMKKCSFGRIINIASVAGVRGAFGKANYAAAKAGLIGMTKSLAQEVAKYNITVNAICPGWIETELNATIPAKYKTLSLSQVAMGRMGTPSEVASIVEYLAEKDSSYITGAVIDVNGGWI